MKKCHLRLASSCTNKYVLKCLNPFNILNVFGFVNKGMAIIVAGDAGKESEDDKLTKLNTVRNRRFRDAVKSIQIMTNEITYEADSILD